MRDLPTSRTPARLARTTLVLGCALALTLVPGFVQAQVPARHNTEVSLPHPATIRDLIQPMLIDSVEELAAWIQDGATVGQCSIADNILHCECIAYESEELGTIAIQKLVVWPLDSDENRSVVLEGAGRSTKSEGEITVDWIADIQGDVDPIRMLSTSDPTLVIYLDRLSSSAPAVFPSQEPDIHLLRMGDLRYLPDKANGMFWDFEETRYSTPEYGKPNSTIWLEQDSTQMHASHASLTASPTRFKTNNCRPTIELTDRNPTNIHEVDKPTFKGKTWEVQSNDQYPIIKRDRTITSDHPPDQSGWLPPRLRTSTDNIELSAPAYYFEPLTMGIAPALSLGNWYGGQLHLMQPSRGQDIWKREWMEVTLGYDPGEDDTPLVWSTIGRANLGDSKTHISTSLEAGEDLVWSAARLDREAWSRSWRQDRVGLALHQDGLFLQLYGIQDQAIVEGQNNTLEGGLDLATRVPMSERLHIDVLMRERSGRPDVELEPDDTDPAQTDVFRHRFQGAVSLGGNHGDRRKAWADWMAGTLIESEVSRESNARLSTSTGNALLAASAGLEFEGRFGRDTHRISPQIDLYATPFGFEKQPDALDEDANDTLAWLIGAVHLKQSLNDLNLALSVWSSYGRHEKNYWTTVLSRQRRWGNGSGCGVTSGAVGPIGERSVSDRVEVDGSIRCNGSLGGNLQLWTSTLDPVARNLLGLSSFQQPITPATHILVRDTFEAASSAASSSRIWSHGTGFYLGSPNEGFELGSTLYYTPTTNAYGGSASVQLAPRSSWPGRAGWSVRGMAGYNKPSGDPRELMFLLGLSVPMAW